MLVDSPERFRSSIAAFHDRGYTVRIPAVTVLSPALARLTRALEFMIQQPVKASLFWSAAGARAPIHYDDNDNIVVQLTGHKQWLVSSAPASLHNAWRDVAETPPPLGDHRTIDLAPGSLLYVPRGTPHTVIARSDSLHLAITFTPVTVRDVMIAALDDLSDRERSFRESAVGRIDGPRDMQDLTHIVGRALAALQAQCRSPEFIATALERRASRVVGAMDRLAAGMPADTGPSTMVRQTPLAICHLLATPTTIDFCQPGEHINIHRGVEPALRFIGATSSFRLSDLPGGLPDSVRIALVDRLITSGFLERCA